MILTPIVRYTTETLGRVPERHDRHVEGGLDPLPHDAPPPARLAAAPSPRSDLVHLVTDWWPRVRLLEDEDELAPGLRTWQCGVHHRSTLVVEVDTPDGVVAISDAWFVYENVEGENWRPLGLNESFEEMFRTNARALRTADHLVPLYDHRVFERYPGGVISRGPAAS